MPPKQSDPQGDPRQKVPSSETSNATEGHSVDGLFDEYLDAEENGDEVDIDELVSRAGSGATELRQLIAASARAQRVGRGHTPAKVPSSHTQATRALPARLGRFELLEHLGSGGLAQVYRAHDHKLKRDVAIKLLDHRGELGEQERGLLLNEARSLAPLEHPGVVKLHDALELDQMLAIVLEFVPGVTLSSVNLQRKAQAAPNPPDREPDVETPGAAKPSNAQPDNPQMAAAMERLSTYRGRVQLLLDLARAVAYCHDRGVLHRDLKPGNVILRPDGTPTIVDFGLAHVAEVFEDKTSQITQSFQGTPEYLAPEQVEEMRTGANPATDQFALGVMLYELLTRSTPFRKQGQTMTLAAVAKAEYEKPRNFDPSIPLDLELICRHCLERRPEDRYPDVEALALDLEAFLEHRPISLSDLSAFKQAALFVRRNKRAVKTASALFAFLLALIIGMQFVVAIDSRSELKQRAAALKVKDISTPAQFTASAHEIAALKTEAARRDESFFARWIGPPLGDHVESLSIEWSQQLGQVLQKKEETAANYGMDVAWAPWRISLGLDEILNPSSEINLFNRERGMVTLPDGIDLSSVKLFQYIPVSKANSRVPRLFARDYEEILSAGTYRIHCLSEESERPINIEFSILNNWSLKTELDLRPPSKLMMSSLVEVSSGKLILPNDYYIDLDTGQQVTPNGGSRDEKLWVEPNIDGGENQIPKFHISSNPVTWKQLKEQFEDAPAEAIERLGVAANFFSFIRPDENQPAVDITWQQASEIARYCGLRLPTKLELVYARNEGVIFPVTINGFDADEFNGQPVHHTSAHPISWEEVDAFPNGPIYMWSNKSGLPPDSLPATNSPIVLRFAYSEESVGYRPRFSK